MGLNELFYPKSVAVIGASSEAGKVGNDLVKNLMSQKFSGFIYPVNPKATEIYGLKCYPSVSDLPTTPDLAIFAIPAALVAGVFEECGKKGVRAAVIISAGFREIGEEGKAREALLKETAKKYDIALIGPNCLGIINPEVNLNASFASLMPSTGSVAFISQSGALCTSVLDYAQSLGVGFSKFVSIGNKAVIDEIELIRYLTDDPKTKVIMMYEEQLERGEEFIKVVGELTSRAHATPVISLKAGRTTAGASASASHTGALGGDDTIIDAIFRKSGVIRAYSIEELFDHAIAFAHNPLPESNRVAIVTNAGGPGVLTADESTNHGLAVDKLSLGAQEKLKKVLPPAANVHNPVDVLGDAKADRYLAAIDTVLSEPQIDAAIVLLTPQTTTEIKETAKVIIEQKKKHDKPVIASFMGVKSVEPGVKMLQEAGIATVSFPEDAASSMGALTYFSLRLKEPHSNILDPANFDRKKICALLEDVKPDGSFVPEGKMRDILAAAGFNVLTAFTVKNKSELAMHRDRFSGRIAMKILSPDITHKSDAGGVILNILPPDLEAAYDEMMHMVSHKAAKAKIEGVTIEAMAPAGGFEFIVGGKRDYQLDVGVVMVGTGGIYVEVYKDIAFGATPVTEHEARLMLGRTKTSTILEGLRGKPPLDRPTLIDAIGRISNLIEEFPEIAEIDINPLMLFEKGALVVDGRMKMKFRNPAEN